MVDAPTAVPSVEDHRAGPRPPGGSRPILWATVAVAVVLAALVALLQLGGDGDRIESVVGEPVPAIRAETVHGEPFDLDALVDGRRWVVVNIFATWCPPCVDEHPELVEFARRHETADDAAVVSVVFNEPADTVRDFFAEEGGDWPVLTDPDGDIAVDLAVTGVPESFLVSPEGLVVELVRGGVTADGLDATIAAASAALYGTGPGS